MNKAEIEENIKKLLKEQRDIYNKADSERREMISRETKAGTDPSFFEDTFFYNGYIFTTDLANIIAYSVFEKPAIIHHERNHYHGTYDEYNLTDEESKVVRKIENGMIKNKIIKMSKSGTMCKVLI